ncbi:MAG: PIN domain-containing protein [Limisphaerales bacterium]
MTYLLDTNTASEPTRPAPDARCLAWLAANQADCALSSVTLGEMSYGVERLPEGKRRNALARAFAFLCQDYAERFYNFDGPSAVELGRYTAGLEQQFGAEWWKTFDYRDTQIAAIAREYGLTIATRNEKHFPGCHTVNPWLN